MTKRWPLTLSAVAMIVLTAPQINLADETKNTEKLSVDNSQNDKENQGTEPFFKIGSRFMITKKDETVETDFGTIKLNADSACLMISTEQEIAIYNLHSKNPIRLEAETETLSIHPGRCIILTNEIGKTFSELNPCQAVAYDRLSNRTLNGKNELFEAEFLTRSMLAVPLFQNLKSTVPEFGQKWMPKIEKAENYRLSLEPKDHHFQFYLYPKR